MKPTMLVILDGFGYSAETDYNAIAKAETPNLDAWLAQYPHALLQASGKAVGLLDHFMGNSEVGHLTIGAGRVIEQPMTIIRRTLMDKSFFKNPVLVAQLKKLAASGDALHIMGLLSDAGVHSDLALMYALIDAAHQHGIKYVYIHPFLDGRDSAPRSAARYLEQLDNALTTFEFGSIGSIHGRYYAMDRDNNWDRTQQSYNTLTQNNEFIPRPWEEVLQEQYAKGISDEFIVPTQIDPTGNIQKNDGVIFFNVRPDRARQLTAAFVDPDFTGFTRKKLALSFFMTPVAYADALPTTVLFAQPPITNTLKDVLAAHRKTIFAIAETEKYAHITYFFNGKKEDPVVGETRVLIPSLKAKNYVDHPEMAAAQITDAVIASLTKNPSDFYLINYANADMVGHSGSLQATKKAVECLDHELKRLYDVVVHKMSGTLYITADHGKAEQMFDLEAKQPKTGHTTNPVPFMMLKKGVDPALHLPLAQLADIAPFILHNMDLPVPQEMEKV